MCVYAAPALARGVEPAAVVAADASATECEPSVLHVRRHRQSVLVGERLELWGTLEEGSARAPAGRAIALERKEGHAWRTLAHTSTGASGRFRMSYVPMRTGAGKLRLVFGGSATAGPTTRPAGRLEVFRLAEASWYGGGGSLACGGELTSSTLGVANKTLPCGTLVTLRYDGHTIRVPVIDRGPYVEGREFDLTEATKRELGFGGTGEVWTIA